MLEVLFVAEVLSPPPALVDPVALVDALGALPPLPAWACDVGASVAQAMAKVVSTNAAVVIGVGKPRIREAWFMHAVPARWPVERPLHP